MGGLMMDAPSPVAALLFELTHRGIELRAARDRVQYRPRGAMTPELAERVKAREAELVAVLRGRASTDSEQRGSALLVDAGPRQTHRQKPGEPMCGPCLAECLAIGYVNPGWTPGSWAVRLRQLADRCEGVRPKLAGEYRIWAGNIERKGR